MRNGKALFACVAFAGAAIGATAAPEISDVTLTPNNAGMVTITYKLTGEDAVVTPDVLTNGVSIGDANIRGFVGDINKLIAASNVTRTIYWCPRTFWPNQLIEENKLQVKLTAWPKANPPDYMAQSIYTPDIRYFYPSAEAVPGGVTNRAYKTNLLLMRRIHAAGVEWTSGAPENDPTYVAPDSANATILAHAVTLTNDYYIGVYETTVAQVKFGAYQDSSNARINYGMYMSQFTNETLFAQPDAFVRPFDSMSWCRLRMDTTDSRNSYHWPECGHAVHPSSPGALFRKATGLELDLPTEAQWEFAARAGVCGYYAGDCDEIAWHKGNWRNDPMRVQYGNANNSHEVGLLKPNGFGLFDMLGNLCEWCLDPLPDKYNATLTDPYKGAATIEPVGAYGAPADVNHVLCGGDCGEASDILSCSRRKSAAYGAYNAARGFRLVCPATLP